VAQSIARKVAVTVTSEEHARLAATRSVSPDVYESYLKGRFALDKSSNRADVDVSISDFEEAINETRRLHQRTSAWQWRIRNSPRLLSVLLPKGNVREPWAQPKSTGAQPGACGSTTTF